MGVLGQFLGAAAAMATDPPVLVVAVLVGVYAHTWRRFILATTIAGVLLHLAISVVVSDYRLGLGLPAGYAHYALKSALPRLAGFLFVAAIAAAAAWGFRRLRAPSSGH